MTSNAQAAALEAPVAADDEGAAAKRPRSKRLLPPELLGRTLEFLSLGEALRCRASRAFTGALVFCRDVHISGFQGQFGKIYELVGLLRGVRRVTLDCSSGIELRALIVTLEDSCAAGANALHGDAFCKSFRRVEKLTVLCSIDATYALDVVPGLFYGLERLGRSIRDGCFPELKGFFIRCYDDDEARRQVNPFHIVECDDLDNSDVEEDHPRSRWHAMLDALPPRLAFIAALAMGEQSHWLTGRLAAAQPFDLNGTVCGETCLDLLLSVPRGDLGYLVKQFHEKGMSLAAPPYQSPLTKAIRIPSIYGDGSDKLMVVRALLRRGFDPNLGSPSPLLAVCGARVGTRDVYQYEHDIVGSCMFDVCSALLDAGACPFAVFDGKPAMYFVTQWVAYVSSATRGSFTELTKWREQRVYDGGTAAENAAAERKRQFRITYHRQRLDQLSCWSDELQRVMRLLALATQDYHARGRVDVDSYNLSRHD